MLQLCVVRCYVDHAKHAEEGITIIGLIILI